MLNAVILIIVVSLSSTFCWSKEPLPPHYQQAPADQKQERPNKSQNEPSTDPAKASPSSSVKSESQKNNSDEANAERDQKQQNWWEKFWYDVRWTDVALTIFTGLLFVVTGILAHIGREQNRHFRQVERAFVFLQTIRAERLAEIAQDKNVEPSTNIVGVMLFPILFNSGNTPTRRMLVYGNSYIGKTPLANDFDFSDRQQSPGEPQILRPTLIGPKAELYFPPIPLSNIQLTDIASGGAFAYIWGWADYDDVFSSENRHRTEYCRQIVVAGDPQVGWMFNFIIHPKFNGMDADCMRRPAPWKRIQ